MSTNSQHSSSQGQDFSQLQAPPPDYPPYGLPASSQDETVLFQSTILDAWNPELFPFPDFVTSMPSSSTQTTPNITQPNVPHRQIHNDNTNPLDTKESTHGTRQNNPPKPPSFPCEFCTVVCTRKHDLKRHREVMHYGQKPFPCGMCQSVFARASQRDVSNLSIICSNEMGRRTCYSSTAGSRVRGKDHSRRSSSSLSLGSSD